MPLHTDLSGSPYFDDFNEDKNFHKVLFQPSVSVQTRELNQLQSILQHQIEQFGDNIYKQGTIIDGCNFSFHPSIPYVKIKDIETDGTRVLVDRYKGFYAKNSSNLVSEIVEVATGYESATDKNTLFVNYLNSGDNLHTHSYSADDVLTIYNPAGTVEKIAIQDGSVGFSNTDTVVILSAISVTNTTGGVDFSTPFSPGDLLTNTVVANAEIVEVDTTSDQDSVILRIKPLSSDLVSPTANAANWTFSASDSFSCDNGSAGIVLGPIGSGANTSLVTNGVGTINRITVLESGTGYKIKPTVSVYSHTATTGQIDNLNLDAQTFIGRTTITGAATVPVGIGYGLSVDQGVVYQKGYFVRVDPQFVIVSRYDRPHNLMAGFKTDEEIINSNIDPTLLDNSLGMPNVTAPGANRLKLSAKLVVMEKATAEADSTFLSIIEFSGGEPYQQKKQTQYNIVNDEISKRFYENSGNFVLDQFLLNTSSETNFADEDTSFVSVIDPGTAYINGYRVSTDANYNLSIEKGLDTKTAGVTASLNYGNYVKLKDLGGSWNFKSGEQVYLHAGQAQYIRLNPGSVPNQPGSDIIGMARIRSITQESGVPGTRSAIYRLYLFDIQMNSGRAFGETRSIFYDGVHKALADTVTITDPISNKVICQLYDSKLNSLVFDNGVKATKSITNGSYVYRTIDETLTANQAGYVVFNSGVNEVFPYPSGSLSTNQEADLIVTPLANGQASANFNGTYQIYSTNTLLEGVGTAFISDLTAGDWIKVANTVSNVIVQIASVANNTSATLTANASANISANGLLYFPQYVPISLADTDRWANVSASANQMTMFIGTSLDSDLDVSVAYNVKSSASQVDKTVHRDVHVRLDLDSNDGTTVGPWALGIPDVFRLKSVYVANGASNTLSINAVSNVVSSDDFILYDQHRFANGDTVLYVGGTWVLPGLSNNTSYFVVESNTSGFKLSTDGTTPLGINASATNDISHTFTGTPFYFGADTPGAENITNDFYIDHNQTENFYNTSYLYTIPNPSVNLSSTDVLLVSFDAFTHSADAGLKHIESYNIDDGVTLEYSNTTINTLEIPQLYSTQDVYYDLRDSIDVRPHVIATANVNANTLTSYTVNPTEPPANTKFSTTDKKFPAPESSFSGSMEYYLGRYDRVVVDNLGNIRSLKGESGTDNIAAEPVNSLTINILNIPPYPSYPLSLSEETVKFADTKLANEKYLWKRLQDYRVTTTFKLSDIREEQPKVYRMSDIGSMDRRIADLEYYVALTMAETSITNKVIPSSIDESLERFKYGFFVDSFSSDIYSDLDNPEYNAAIINGDLVPVYSELNLEFKFNTANSTIAALTRGSNFITAPYDEYTLITQGVATDGAINTANTVTKCSQQLTSVDVVNRSTSYNINGLVYEDWGFTFSDTSFSPVELYMNCTDNDTAVVVYQTNNSTYQNAEILTSSQYATPNLRGTQYVQPGGKAYLVGGRTRWENDTGFQSGGPAEAGGLWIEDSYRLTWNHDASKGKYYIIRVYKGAHTVNNHSADSPLGTYAFRLWFPVDNCGSHSTPTTADTINFQYQGTSVLEEPKQAALTGITVYNLPGTTSGRHNLGSRHGGTTTSSYVMNVLGIEVSAYGLKPNTEHKIYLNGIDQTTTTLLRNVTGNINITTWLSNWPASVSLGTIASDGAGKISCVIFKEFENISTQFALQNLLATLNSSNTKILICSTDIQPSQIAQNYDSYKTARSYSHTALQAKSYTGHALKAGGR